MYNITKKKKREKMFYKSKHDNTIIELIDSGFNYCIVIDTDNISDFSSIENKYQTSQSTQSTQSTQLPTGRILKYSKKELKKHYKKIKSSKNTLKPLSSNIKAQIIELFKDYKFEVLHDTEHFLLEQQKKQIKKEIEEQSEADRNRLLKALAD